MREGGGDRYSEVQSERWGMRAVSDFVDGDVHGRDLGVVHAHEVQQVSGVVGDGDVDGDAELAGFGLRSVGGDLGTGQRQRRQSPRHR